MTDCGLVGLYTSALAVWSNTVLVLFTHTAVVVDGTTCVLCSGVGFFSEGCSPLVLAFMSQQPVQVPIVSNHNYAGMMSTSTLSTSIRGATILADMKLL